MKSIILKLFAGFFLIALVACNNEKTETATPEKTTTTPAVKEEPKKTEVSVGPDGAEIKTKNGEEVKVGESGGSVGTKDVKIKISTKDSSK